MAFAMRGGLQEIFCNLSRIGRMMNLQLFIIVMQNLKMAKKNRFDMIQFNGSFLPKAHAALTPSRFRVQT
jgi:hypothetical protein